MFPSAATVTRLLLAWKILTGAGLVEALAAAKSCEGCDGRDYVIRELRRFLDEERSFRARAEERLLESMRPKPVFPTLTPPDEQAYASRAVPPGGF